jgi:sugar phosphate isomerase/epimerase
MDRRRHPRKVFPIAPCRGIAMIRSMNRRRFLTCSATVSLSLIPASRALASLAPDNRYRKEIGLQLYTLRDPLAKDAAGTLKQVADAGYHQIELFATPLNKTIITVAKELGLAMHSTHFNAETVIDPQKAGDGSAFQALAETAKGDGFSELVIPYTPAPLRQSLDDYKRLAERINKAAGVAKAQGLRLSYHNHAFEFQPIGGTRSGYDVFIDEFGPDAFFEVDVFWVAVAKLDPVALIERLKGRVSQLHLKDLKAGLELPIYDGLGNDAFKELGNGSIPMEPILNAAAASGVSHCHVEQDHSPDALASVKTSIKYLASM